MVQVSDFFFRGSFFEGGIQTWPQPVMSFLSPGPFRSGPGNGRPKKGDGLVFGILV